MINFIKHTTFIFQKKKTHTTFKIITKIKLWFDLESDKKSYGRSDL